MTRRRVTVAPEFEAWRVEARAALAEGFRPEEIVFDDATAERPLELGLDMETAPTGPSIVAPHGTKEFLDAARAVACHRDAGRWDLLYRLLWRLQGERNLLRIEVDDDVAKMRRMEAQVRRDLHKMHAFVRFRKVEGAGGEHFVAWYQPDHRIVRLAAPFFRERFGVMRWVILTPEESMSWEPGSVEVIFGEGTGSEAAPPEDELENLWRSYYGSIFNPARLNAKAMRSEMPVRYWRNLPELAQLPQMMQQAEGRVATMVTKQKEQPTATPFVPKEASLPVLREALPGCRGCELYKQATQVVPGVGAARAKLMLVGEQPGEQEDLQGAPFVGPAGQVLQRAMEELSIYGKNVYLTNAVKHFKFVQRGKLRLHQSPRMSEVSACRPWLKAEIEAVRPQVILCLGATAAKSLLGGTFALMHDRGKMMETAYSEHVMATVHPSAVLRARDGEGRAQLYAFLKEDLALAYAVAMGNG